ncbi:hypothetical protein DXG01_003832 [Tephrocybe rancida]|nr:hypothetical protein DXG01_003832 [Tephrocybe rancida]
MGVWANGASQEAIYWLIKERIPVYIAHNCDNDDLKHCQETKLCTSAVLESDIARLHPTQNYLESLAHGKIIKNSRSDPWIYPAELLEVPTPEIHQHSFSRNLGWIGTPGISKNREKGTENVAAQANSPVPPDLHMQDENPPQHPSQALELITLWNEHIPWIQPPMVAKVGVGAWEHWELDVEDGEERMQKMKGDDEGYTYYDCELR